MEAEIAKDFNYLLMVEITPDHMTGKEAIELSKGRKKDVLDMERQSTGG